MAALGEPAVPLVKISTANWSASTSDVGAGSAAIRASNGTASSPTVVPDAESGPITRRMSASDEASRRRHTLAAVASTTTATTPAAPSSRSSSLAGLLGLSGTATAPMPTVAR
jgi:hypothetical protein